MYSSVCTAVCVQQCMYSSVCTAVCVQQCVYSSVCTAVCVQCVCVDTCPYDCAYLWAVMHTLTRFMASNTCTSPFYEKEGERE